MIDDDANCKRAAEAFRMQGRGMDNFIKDMESHAEMHRQVNSDETADQLEEIIKYLRAR